MNTSAQERLAAALTIAKSSIGLAGKDVESCGGDIFVASREGNLRKIDEVVERACILPQGGVRDLLMHGLSSAVYYGRMDSIRYLMSLGAPIADLRGAGMSALHSKNIEVFQLLLDNGWNVNESGSDGPVIA